MPFQKGNKLAKGRPKGSRNKAKNVQKFENVRDGVKHIDLPLLID
tara:strand:- start:119 stop:253 length:135 start_codon:yes stop_codon:yes gene_type:complete